MLKARLRSDSCCWPLKTVIWYFSVAVESQLLRTWDPHEVECWSRRGSAGCCCHQCLCFAYILDYFSVASIGRLQHGSLWICKALVTFTTDLRRWHELRTMFQISKRFVNCRSLSCALRKKLLIFNHRLRTIFAVFLSDLMRSMAQTPLRRTACNCKLKSSNLSVENRN